MAKRRILKYATRVKSCGRVGISCVIELLESRHAVVHTLPPTTICMLLDSCRENLGHFGQLPSKTSANLFFEPGFDVRLPSEKFDTSILSSLIQVSYDKLRETAQILYTVPGFGCHGPFFHQPFHVYWYYNVQVQRINKSQ